MAQPELELDSSVVELLNGDSRPTFVVDISPAPSPANAATPDLAVVFANTALLACLPTPGCPAVRVP